MRNIISVAMTVVLFGGGCIDTDPITEYRDLSYKKYSELVSIRVVDPVDAESISYKCYFLRDGYDEWWKMQISHDDFLEVVKQIGLEDPKPYVPASKPTGALGIPDTWPIPDDPAPDWWAPPANFGSMILTSQSQEASGGRARGWYWLYDNQSSTAIGWHWNRQYWTFEPTKSGP